MSEDVRTVVAGTADQMKLRAPRWLYHLRIPSDAITLLAGREGIGKSTIAFDIAARLTRGRLPGYYLGHQRAVGVVAAEDSWESVILPRLMAAEADLTRVYRIEARTEVGYETIVAPTDLRALGELCTNKAIALVVVDPLMSVMPGNLDTHKDREVRRALDPLSKFCREQRRAVLGLIHVNKSSNSDPLDSIMASRAFTAVSRSVLYCVADPDAEQEDRFLFGHTKSNLGPTQPTLGYQLGEHKILIEEPEEPDESVIVTSRAIWTGEDTRRIREVLETPKPSEGKAKGKLTIELTAWLTGRGMSARRDEIAEAFPDVKRETLDSALSRLVSRGVFVRPGNVQGIYALADASSCSPSIPSQVQEVQEVSDRLAGLADPALAQASEDVQDDQPTLFDSTLSTLSTAREEGS